MMGGAAVKDLFLSSILTKDQYEYLKPRFLEFGKWTLKIISRQDLLKKLNSEETTFELFLKCWEHKKQFKENLLIEVILEKTEEIRILEFISNAEISKKIKHRALFKLNQLAKK
ncbi:hypothetical protein [Aureispira sp. CCB-QB1]|uniref:hypothetical protein n=1 Tax=Aureispira sp. CCB-QB1 TaxID=1313421 RepID=UPI000696AC7C|nr:hypothetical protein [Aureispira sp. CCB-QB1]